MVSPHKILPTSISAAVWFPLFQGMFISILGPSFCSFLCCRWPVITSICSLYSTACPGRDNTEQWENPERRQRTTGYKCQLMKHTRSHRTFNSFVESWQISVPAFSKCEEPGCRLGRTISTISAFGMWSNRCCINNNQESIHEIRRGSTPKYEAPTWADALSSGETLYRGYVSPPPLDAQRQLQPHGKKLIPSLAVTHGLFTFTSSSSFPLCLLL